MGETREEEIKDSDMVWVSSRCIARDTSGLDYSRDSEGSGKKETVSIGNSVEYI